MLSALLLPLLAQTPPNVIVVFVDDLGYGDLGCYGSTVNRTPHIDRLAAEGTRFTDFYVASSVCTPSRAALLTGCYPRRVGLERDALGRCVLFPSGERGLNPNEVTLPELLQVHGYATACVGKWHLGDQPPFLPTRHGFDRYYGLPYSNDMGARANDATRPPLPLVWGEEVVEAPAAQEQLTARYTEEALRFLRSHAHEPFFLYLPHTMVHLPLRPGPAFAGRSANGAYGDALEEIDASTGRIVATLRELGIAERTLLVFTSDNGSTGRNGGSNAPLRGRKGTTWEGGQRVPAVVWWPGRVPAGRVCAQLTSTLDLLPTVCALAGIEAAPVDGHDQSALWLGVRGARSPCADFAYYQMDQLQAVRGPRYKLHLALDEKLRNWGDPEGPTPLALYDLREDIAETTDVAGAHPEVVARLRAAADRWREDLGDLGRPGPGCREPGTVTHPKALK